MVHIASGIKITVVLKTSAYWAGLFNLNNWLYSFIAVNCVVLIKFSNIGST